MIVFGRFAGDDSPRTALRTRTLAASKSRSPVSAATGPVQTTVPSAITRRQAMRGTKMMVGANHWTTRRHMPSEVLFIHGWWSGAWIWSHVVGQFASAGFQTHALDLPGPETGKSCFADHLEYALNAAREIGNPILVGHSAGGLLAMKMCETLDPPACVAITPAAPAGVLPRPNVLLLRFLASALPSILFGRDFFPRALLPQIALNLVPPMEQAEVLARMRPVSASQVRMIIPSLVRVAPRRIRSPLLIVGAAADRLTPVSQTRAIVRRYGADYRECPDSGHFILVEKGWPKMTSDVISWIDRGRAKLQ